ncbi:MAG: exosortase/archaeosortase family protein [Nitrososphaerota archaeon]|nr:exosortase/archaeosortase family protein [Nitrososphaerota archaeon]
MSIALATAFTLVVYSAQFVLLVSKLGEVFGGVFDTSVPAYPLAGMFFVVLFLAFRRKELLQRVMDQGRSWGATLTGAVVAGAPFAALLAAPSLSQSYSFAGVALVCSWFGVLVALRPAVLSFLAPYFLLYIVAVGLVGALTAAFGDPLAIAVATLSSAFTHLLGLGVQWSSVYIDFVAAGGQPVSLVITQECSGVASMSIFLLVLGLMHLDLKANLRTSAWFAVGGSALFILLNSLRVDGIILGGIYVGTDFMWSLHGWLGYALYIFGYFFLIFLYARAKSDHDGDKGNLVKSFDRNPASPQL